VFCFVLFCGLCRQASANQQAPMQGISELDNSDLDGLDQDGDVDMTAEAAFDSCVNLDGTINKQQLNVCDWNSIQPRLATLIALHFGSSIENVKALPRPMLESFIDVLNRRIASQAAQPSTPPTPSTPTSRGASGASAAASGSGSSAGSTAADQPPMIEIANKDVIKAAIVKYSAAGQTPSVWFQVEKMLVGMGAASVSHTHSHCARHPPQHAPCALSAWLTQRCGSRVVC